MSDDDITHPPDAFWQAVEQFNQGAFYECHDTLEAIWMVATAAEKPFYQGILQIAVAFYHLGNHNWHGAAILTGEGMRRLEPFEPAYNGIDVTDFLDRASLWLDALQALGPDHIQPLASTLGGQLPTGDSSFDWQTLPPLKIQLL